MPNDEQNHSRNWPTYASFGFRFWGPLETPRGSYLMYFWALSKAGRSGQIRRTHRFRDISKKLFCPLFTTTTGFGAQLLSSYWGYKNLPMLHGILRASSTFLRPFRGCTEVAISYKVDFAEKHAQKWLLQKAGFTKTAPDSFLML